MKYHEQLHENTAIYIPVQPILQNTKHSLHIYSRGISSTVITTYMYLILDIVVADLDVATMDEVLHNTSVVLS